MTPREIVDDILATHSASWSETDRSLIARVAANAARLAAQEASGAAFGMASIQPELAQLKAQLANLSAAAAQNASNVVRSALERILLDAVGIAVKGLGVIA